ncbi:DUF6457 domain-containing protein [Salinibacterium sp. M195]|uniref:DUF6457 domain-containing protein n=1 Tax=Salinibacterium sp. M195 TaxID=2583374 RepID=UPI001C62941C|nr:DUF6457 domain-containing protein [Salinibacterium sp. M195]
MNSDERKRLDDWSKQLSDELGLTGTPFHGAESVDQILSLAGVAAHAIIRPAAPVTTFLVGYAAGLAVARGSDPAAAAREATDIAQACAERTAADVPPPKGKIL